MNDACAFVLAGGMSSRMGQDKAFLRFGTSTLLGRALDVTRIVIPEVRIVGSAAKFGAFAEVVEDQFAGCGPLGGIHAALDVSTASYNLILAVDMPFVESKWLSYLLDQARASEAVVTLARCGNRWQPLCAIYREHFGTIAESALKAGHNRITSLFADISPRIIDDAELLRAGFSAEMFRNLNTPEEFERASLVKKN
jgi:molybdopterin-guanine dinucleotide biosynthesis protein A